MKDIMKKSMVIYLLTDTTNGMLYVGKTTNKLGRRMQQHTHSNVCHVDQMINEHGWENFTVEILEECNTPLELTEREMYWIATLGTKDPNGYNMTDGGEGTNGYKATDEARKNMSEAHNPSPVLCIETGLSFKNAREAAEWAGVEKAAINRACNGISRSAAGYHWIYVDAPEREDHEVKVVEPKNKCAVRCIELNKVFNSIAEAAEFFGVAWRTIHRACNGERKTAAGYTWEYVDKVAAQTHNGRKKQAVRCIETGEVFESIWAAAKWAGSKPNIIKKACQSGYMVAGKWHFEFVGELTERPVADARPVKCLETGEVFSSMAAAAAWAGVLEKSIGYACKHGNLITGKWHFVYVN